MQLTGGSDAEKTAIFCNMYDNYFDALNVSSYAKGVRQQKKFQLPYTSSNDFRLKVCEVIYPFKQMNVTTITIIYSSGFKMNSYHI